MYQMKMILLIVSLIGSPFIANSDKEVSDHENSPANIRFFMDAVAAPEKVEFELNVINEGKTPVVLEFPTSQKYEIEVLDKNKTLVYKYSAGKAFTQAIDHLRLKAGEKVTWKEKWDYYSEGNRVKEGEYLAVSKLKTLTVNGKETIPVSDEKNIYIPGVNPVFKQIAAEGKNGTYTVKGLVRPSGRKLCYSVEDGHNELIKETEIQFLEASFDWKPFSISVTIPEMQIPANGSLILTLYERSNGLNQEMIHVYPVLLERF